MTRAVLLAVDDDAEVLRSIERDLKKRYAERYRILAASSGREALKVLERLRKRNEPVALLLSDHRMPLMTGVEFLAQAMRHYPTARRVLLTAYADTDAAIRAINEVKLNHYLLKPWHPPEQLLFPVLDDLLDDWNASHRPPFDGIRVLGTRWSAGCYELRDFLARNQVPYRWLDAELEDKDPEVQAALASLEAEDRTFPVVLFPEGPQLHHATPADVAGHIGLQTQPSELFYDLAIVGGGPAGLAAAVYGASEGLHTVLVERDATGGQAGSSSRIENYLGFPSGLSGNDLARRATAQAKRLGAELLSPQEVVGARSEGYYHFIKLGNGVEIACHAMVLAPGVRWRTLDVPGMQKLAGAGVYYGAAPSEAQSCVDQDVYIVGGANSAGQAAMNFSRYARRVIMLVRGSGLHAAMSYYLLDAIAKTPNIEVRTQSEVVEAHGAERLEGLSIRSHATGTVEQVAASSLFIFIGAQPHTDWLAGFVERDKHGFILTGADLLQAGKPPQGWPLDRDPALLETSLPGVFAAGDARHGSIKRVASSVGEGSIAVQFVQRYLASV